MRFVTPIQTLSEYKHRQMPVYETLATIGAAAMPALGAIGSTALQALPSVASAAPSILSSLGIGKKQTSIPSFNPQQTLQFQQQEYNQMAPEALQYAAQLYAQAANEGIDFAQRGTAANVSNQDVVTPGSSAQREQALNQLNSYMQGQVPQDVQQQINRQVAQNLGGGFNLFSGGGQAPQNFARNLGQTSLGLSQYGLSAAPTWQQLANSMVVSPTVGLQAGLQAGSLGDQMAGLSAQYGNDLGISNYQSAMNQYQGDTTGNQNQTSLFQGLGSGASSLLNSIGGSNFLKNLLPSGQGAAVTLGSLPSASSAGSYLNNLGFPSAGSGMSSIPNTGGGTAFPFGSQ
jgi:hypothetical protein